MKRDVYIKLNSEQVEWLGNAMNFYAAFKSEAKHEHLLEKPTPENRKCIERITQDIDTAYAIGHALAFPAFVSCSPDSEKSEFVPLAEWVKENA